MLPTIPNSTFIGLGGPSGCGKSTLATALLFALPHPLTRYVVKHGFADELRSEIRDLAHDKGYTDAGIRQLVTDIFRKPTPLYARRLLQWWGTDFRRQQDPNYWIKKYHAWAMRLRRTLEPETHLICLIDDVRFSNEVEFARSNGITFWINNVNPTAKLPSFLASHPSENHIQSKDMDHVITINPATETPDETAKRVLPLILLYTPQSSQLHLCFDERTIKCS